MGVSTPEQHRPPVYACAADAVLHAHAASTLEPAVVLYTFLPSGGGDRLDALEAKVDVHGDGPGSSTLTVRVLSEGQSLSWQLPIAPFVAALPGQPGDDGRMVLLGVLDQEPEQGFWAEPVDCERLAAELQLPVTDLVDALRGRLTPWLADDVDLLLHDDAHEHAADSSPAQTLAAAVLAQYGNDLESESAMRRLARAVDFAPTDYQAELGSRLCAALATAVRLAGTSGIATVLEQTGPFEPEVSRLLTDVPAVLRAGDGAAQDVERTADAVLAGPDHVEAVRAAVSTIGRLARVALGADLPAPALLQRLGMVDDDALARLATLWVELARTSGGNELHDPTVARAVAEQVAAEGVPGDRWLRGTAATLAVLALEAAGRSHGRIAGPTSVLEAYLQAQPPTGGSASVEASTSAVRACVELARFARARAGTGPAAWLQVPIEAAARAVGASLVAGLDREVAVDLFAELLDSDVDGPDMLEAFVCATAHVLVEVGPPDSPEVVQSQVEELLAALPTGPRGARWLMVGCLREAHDHDPAATDVSALLPPGTPEELDRAAAKVGPRGVLAAGLICLDALGSTIAEPLGIPREELLGLVLPRALVEHDLLAPPADV